jgi:magnesium transporter
MITYYIKKEGKLREIDTPELGCWINIMPPFSQEELDEVSHDFEIPLDFLTDSLDIDERSRYDREDNVRHIVLNSPLHNDSSLSSSNAFYVTVPIGIILTTDHTVTITSFENTILEPFKKDKIRNFDPLDEKMFVLQLLEQNVYAYLNALKKLNLQRNLIEKKLLISTENEHLIELLRIEKSLVYFVNALSVTELLNMKMKRSDFLQLNGDEDKIELFEDIIIDTSQALQMANIYANIQGSTMETYGSIINNNVNAVMQRLTLVTIILAVPTLVASLFGMNVPFYGLENNPHALIYILIGSILFALLLAWFFRRKRLL